MGSCLSAESGRPLPDAPPASTLGIRRSRSSNKRSGSRTSSLDHRREDKLHGIPGRMFSNGATDAATLFTQQGKKSTNQDAMLVWENFGSRTDTVFCGVFDGHGPFGHKVAKKVRDSLPLKLSAHWEVNIHSKDVLKEISLNKLGSMNSEDSSFISVDEESRAFVDLEGTEKPPEVFQTLKESFLKAFKVMDRELRMSTNIDCFCSGTTAVTLVKQGKDLVIGNVGDSRAILGTRDKDDSLLAVQLTVDLKPNLPGEAERIRNCRGRVFTLEDEPEVARVWLPNDDSPGLAMARAFGDFCLKDFGLISVPDMSYRRLSEKDEFIVLATDGIWDVLSNKEVVDVVASAPARSTAARAVVESAVRAWRYKYPTSKIDDCAIVCLYLDSSPDGISISSNSKPKEQPPASAERVEDPPAPAGLPRSGTVRTGDDVPEEEKKSQAPKDEQLLLKEEVSRVDTLLNLPRFLPQKR